MRNKALNIRPFGLPNFYTTLKHKSAFNLPLGTFGLLRLYTTLKHIIFETKFSALWNTSFLHYSKTARSTHRISEFFGLLRFYTTLKQLRTASSSSFAFWIASFFHYSKTVPHEQWKHGHLQRTIFLHYSKTQS